VVALPPVVEPLPAVVALLPPVLGPGITPSFPPVELQANKAAPANSDKR
jgi:hypothetical protein